MISAIRTERLNVRRVTADDWRAIQGIWADRAATAYAKYDKPVDTSDAAVLSRIEKWSLFADSEEHMFFAVCLDTVLIGYIAFNRRAEGYEIGYCFHSAFHGKGYAKESISGILSALRQEGVRFGRHRCR